VRIFFFFLIVYFLLLPIARVSVVQPVMCSDLFAEQAIMYKEKVNYKLPGGAGFAPHQDVAAGWWMVRTTQTLAQRSPAQVADDCAPDRGHPATVTDGGVHRTESWAGAGAARVESRIAPPHLYFPLFLPPLFFLFCQYKQTLHISCLVSIDAATEANGCLEVVAGRHTDGMLSDEWKEIPAETVSRFEWKPVPTEPGDVLFFDSYVPHRSAPNQTDAARRVLYVTYTKASEGDFRDRYYADKRVAFPPDCEREPGKNYEYKI
jgi:hypothetical protein